LRGGASSADLHRIRTGVLGPEKLLAIADEVIEIVVPFFAVRESLAGPTRKRGPPASGSAYRGEPDAPARARHAGLLVIAGDPVFTALSLARQFATRQ